MLPAIILVLFINTNLSYCFDGEGIFVPIGYASYVVSVLIRCHHAMPGCSYWAPWEHKCTGIIISDNQVLAPANCCIEKEEKVEGVKQEANAQVIKRNISDIAVLVGTNKIDGGGPSVKDLNRKKVRFVCISEKYKKKAKYDFAILFLEEPLALGGGATIAKTPKGKFYSSSALLEDMIHREETCRLYGWNMTVDDMLDTNQQKQRKLLMSIELRLVDFEFCNTSFTQEDLVFNQHLCAGFKGRDLCDVGSPLVCGGVVWGLYLTSGKCQRDAPSIFYRIDMAMDWRRMALGISDSSAASLCAVSLFSLLWPFLSLLTY